MKSICTIIFLFCCLIVSGQHDNENNFKSYADPAYLTYKKQLEDVYAARLLKKFEIDSILKEYESMGLVSSKSFAKVLSRIYQPGSGIAIIVYFFSNDSLIRILLEPGLVIKSDTVLITRKQIQAANADIFNSLSLYQKSASRTAILRGTEVIVTGESKISFNDAIANATKLLIPAGFDTGYRHLIIVPALNIGAFPFHLLRPFKDSSFLIEHCSFSIAPSLIDIVRKRTERFKSANLNIDEHRFHIDNALFVSNPVYPPHTKYIFPDLPGAKAEVEVAKTYTRSAIVLDSDKATKEKVLSEMYGKDLVYFATHGVADEKDPMNNSFLALTGDSPFLTAKEVIDLRKTNFKLPGLVVLSACQTGLGKPMEAGIAGLARSFLLAGSDHVIMSLWNVDDEATSYLMGRFMYHLEKEYQFTPSAALRLAVLDAKEKYTNPALWASFSSFGVDRGPGAPFEVKNISLKIDTESGLKFSRKDSFFIVHSIKALNRVRSAKQTEDADLVLKKGIKSDSLFIESTGFLFNTSGKRHLQEDLLLFARYKYLKELNLKDSAVRLEIKLGKKLNGVAVFENSGKETEFQIGDTVIVAVKNNSSFTVYINALDIHPDGIISSVVSPANAQTKLTPGSQTIFEKNRIVITSGAEIVKFFVSEKPIDMKKLDGTYYNLPDFILMEMGVAARMAVWGIPFRIAQ